MDSDYIKPPSPPDKFQVFIETVARSRGSPEKPFVFKAWVSCVPLGSFFFSLSCLLILFFIIVVLLSIFFLFLILCFFFSLSVSVSVSSSSCLSIMYIFFLFPILSFLPASLP